MQAVASLLKSLLANRGADPERLRLNSSLTENGIAQDIDFAIDALEMGESWRTEAMALVKEIAALERDSNDEFGDVILDGTTDLFERIQACARKF